MVLNHFDLLTNNSVTKWEKHLENGSPSNGDFIISELLSLPSEFDCITQSCRWSGTKRNLLQIIYVEWTLLFLVNFSWHDFFPSCLGVIHTRTRGWEKITLFATPFKSPALLSSVSHSTLSTHARLGNSCCYTVLGSALASLPLVMGESSSIRSISPYIFFYLFIPFCLLAA